MTYTPTNWVNNVTPGNATNMNHLETQYSEAMLSFQADLITGFVEAGFVATKDGTIANQLDVTSGSAYIQQSDFTKRLHSNSSTTFTTSALSSTYHLYIQPDGTFYWNTANTPATGSLFLAQVTTDGSGNILAVTDERALNPTLLPNLSGEIILPNVTFPKIGGQASVGSFGAPVIVGQALVVNVTATTQQQIFLFTPAVSGFYRFSLSVTYRNPTPQSPTVTLNNWDNALSANTLTHFQTQSAIPGKFLDGTNTPGNNQVLNCVPITAYCGNASATGVFFTDPGGTPNDLVTLVVERLA